ncbi:MAG: sialate O-acetylesterase [Planctomycetota bacterium]
MSPTAAAQDKVLPQPGETFTVDGCAAFVIEPQVAALREGPQPWIWYAPTLRGLPGPEEAWMFERFLAAGVAIAGIDVGESYGSPDGTRRFQALYEHLTATRGYSARPVLLARSRGGLMLYNWATVHPRRVAAIAGIYPVCDLASYPGLERAAPAYGMSAEALAADLAAHNPVDRLAPLAAAGVPILHLHGDRDGTVPLEANSGALRARYAALGGPVEVSVLEGRGHDMWSGWFQSDALVAFAIQHALAGAERAAPTDDLAPVKVYILSGQSNMVGIGQVGANKARQSKGATEGAPEERAEAPGTLTTVVKLEGKFPHLVNAAGQWVVRDDVRYKGLITATADTGLTVGCGANANSIGPELQFGHVVGDYHAEPVLLIKASQGNRSLGWDFLPPGGERFTYEGRTYAGFGDRIPSWTAEDPGKEVDWYAGKQYDDCVRAVHALLDGFGERFPQYASRGYELAGFVWWQGHKDGNAAHASRYEENLVRLIRSLRAEFTAPEAPFVIGTIGFGGWAMSGPHATIAEAQLAVSGETGRYPEFAGNVKTVETRDFWRDASVSPRNQDFHYNGNAETYLLVGEALGRAMLELQRGR